MGTVRESAIKAMDGCVGFGIQHGTSRPIRRTEGMRGALRYKGTWPRENVIVEYVG